MAKQPPLTDAEVKELRALLKAINRRSATVATFVKEAAETQKLAYSTAEKVRKCGC